LESVGLVNFWRVVLSVFWLSESLDGHRHSYQAFLTGTCRLKSLDHQNTRAGCARALRFEDLTSSRALDSPPKCTQTPSPQPSCPSLQRLDPAPMTLATQQALP